MAKYNFVIKARIDDETAQLIDSLKKKEVMDQSDIIREAIYFYCNYRLNDCDTNIFKRTITFEKLTCKDATDRD